MMTSMDASEANDLRTGTLSDFWGDFILPKCSTREGYGTGDNTTGSQASPRGIPQRAGSASTPTCTTPAPVHDPESLKSRPGEPAKEEMWRGEHGSLCHTAAKPLNTTYSTLSNSKQNLNVGNPTGTGERESREICKWSCLVCTL